MSDVISFNEIFPGQSVPISSVDGIQYLSIRKIIQVVCNKNSNHAAEVWRRMSVEKKNLLDWTDVPFHHKSGRIELKPGITLHGSIRLIRYLDVDAAERYMQKFATIVVGYIGGDTNMINEMVQNGNSDEPLAVMARAELARGVVEPQDTIADEPPVLQDETTAIAKKRKDSDQSTRLDIVRGQYTEWDRLDKKLAMEEEECLRVIKMQKLRDEAEIEAKKKRDEADIEAKKKRDEADIEAQKQKHQVDLEAKKQMDQVELEAKKQRDQADIELQKQKEQMQVDIQMIRERGAIELQKMRDMAQKAKDQQMADDHERANLAKEQAAQKAKTQAELEVQMIQANAQLEKDRAAFEAQKAKDQAELEADKAALEAQKSKKKTLRVPGTKKRGCFENNESVDDGSPRLTVEDVIKKHNLDVEEIMLMFIGWKVIVRFIKDGHLARIPSDVDGYRYPESFESVILDTINSIIRD